MEVLKKHLMETENIAEEKIAVATGDQRDLDTIDLFDPRTKIEYVITVEALKEGLGLFLRLCVLFRRSHKERHRR